MERKKILTWMGFFGLSFIILSVLELVVFFLFYMGVPMDLSGNINPIINVILYSGLMTPHASLLMIISFIVILIFFCLGYFVFNAARKKKLKDFDLSRFWLVIGLFLILGGFIKMEFLVLLARSTIMGSIPDVEIFHDALFNITITPLIGPILWYFFSVFVCYFLISGLIFGGVGLKWYLDIQENQPKNS